MRSQGALSQYLRNTQQPYGDDDKSAGGAAGQWSSEGSDDGASAGLGTVSANFGAAAAGIITARLGGDTASATFEPAFANAYDGEVSFVSGVDATHHVVGTSYDTWNGNNPATYGSPNTVRSTAHKWGSTTI